MQKKDKFESKLPFRPCPASFISNLSTSITSNDNKTIGRNTSHIKAKYSVVICTSIKVMYVLGTYINGLEFVLLFAGQKIIMDGCRMRKSLFTMTRS